MISPCTGHWNNHPFPKVKLGVVLGIIAVVTIVISSAIALWYVQFIPVIRFAEALHFVKVQNTII